ncbi:MAG: hypothetical protein WBP43_02220 [Chitinophagales bacterium]|nr:hypothetical protein [Bacteroidota bacterium]
MKFRIVIFLFTALLFTNKIYAQSSTLGVDTNVVSGNDSLTIIGTDTIIGPPITFRSYNERFIDFMFFDGSFNVVSFHITEKSSSFQLMLSSLDSSTYCFSVSPEEFKILMAYMKQFNDELLAQPNYPIKCNYCQTLQMFWYDGDKERSTIKRSYRIPSVFNEILEFCYDVSSDDKRKCSIELNYFHSLEGFEDNLKGPSSNK